MIILIINVKEDIIYFTVVEIEVYGNYMRYLEFNSLVVI